MHQPDRRNANLDRSYPTFVTSQPLRLTQPPPPPIYGVQPHE
jgi:hypothetical protein